MLWIINVMGAIITTLVGKNADWVEIQKIVPFTLY